MNNIVKNQTGTLRELIDSSNDVGIVLSENHNVDSVASALALFLILQAEGKNVQIVSKKDPSVEVSNLVGVDKIKKSFGGVARIFTISVPYREGDIEKVSYNIEGDKLNVNLFAEERGININESDIQYIRQGSQPSLVITVGVQSEQEIAGLIDPKTTRTIHIDRSPMSELMGDVTLVDPSFSSISEIVTEMISNLSLLPDVDAFQNLMDGIAFATRNFTLPTTSGFAFEAAGFLLQNGAKRRERRDERQEQRGQDRSDRQDRFQNQPRRDNRDNRQPRQDRNFPNPSHFLNQRPPRNPQQNQGQNQNMPKNQPQRDALPARDAQTSQPKSSFQPFDPIDDFDQVQEPQVVEQPQVMAQPKVSQSPWDDLNQAPKPYVAPKEASGLDLSGENSDKSFTEGSLPEDIPDDWFLPKVFKGSKKGN